jgi:hypothetical protein
MPEKGRQVRCGDCGNVWWQEAQEMLVLDPRREGVLEKERISHNVNPGLNILEKSLADEERPRGLKAFIHRFYLDWFVIVTAIGIVGFVTYRERATLFDHAPSLKRVLNPRVGGNPAAAGPGLIVQGINYDATHHNNVPHLLVTGEIVNVSSQSVSIPHLTITISVKNNGQVMKPKSHSWQHANKGEELLPGGRLPFQTITTHPGWSTIDKIDVSY